MTDLPADKRSRATVEAWLHGLARAEEEGYSPLVSFRDLVDGAGVETESRAWAARFFSSGASPYAKGARVVRATHAASTETFDVLRHEYSALGMSLVLRETAAFAVLEIARGGEDVLNLRPQDRPERIHQIAERVLAVSGSFIGRNMQEQPYHWSFLFPTDVVEGCVYTTNPDADVNWLWSWADRVDGGIQHGRPYFVLYKHREATDGKVVFLNMRHWFDGACWRPYQGAGRR